MNRFGHIYRSRLRKGFTLTEAIFASTIGLVIVAMAASVIYTLMKIYTVSDIKNSVSADYRTFTRQLTDKGTAASGFYIYPSFTGVVRDPTGAASRVKTGSAGDLLVLVYFDVSHLAADPNMTRVTRIVGFYKYQPATGSPQIRSFDSSIPSQNWRDFTAKNTVQIYWPDTTKSPLPAAPAGSYTIESLLPPLNMASTFPIIAYQTSGTGGDGIFYKNLNTMSALDPTKTDATIFSSDAFSVSGQIARPNGTANQTVSGYTSQSAFTITVSPASSFSTP